MLTYWSLEQVNFDHHHNKPVWCYNHDSDVAYGYSNYYSVASNSLYMPNIKGVTDLQYYDYDDRCYEATMRFLQR